MSGARGFVLIATRRARGRRRGGTLGGDGGEPGEAEEDGGGAAGGGGAAAALLAGLQVAGADGDVLVLGGVVVHDADEGAGDEGEMAGGEEADAGGEGGFERGDACGDVVTGEEEGEVLEGGLVAEGDLEEGHVGVGEVVEEGDDLIRGRIEGGGVGLRGEGGHDGPIVRSIFGLSRGFW